MSDPYREPCMSCVELNENNKRLSEAYNQLDKSLTEAKKKKRPFFQGPFFPSDIQFGFYLLWLVIFIATIGAGAALYKAATVDGRVDYCYVQFSAFYQKFYVKAHRNWSEDLSIGFFTNPGEAEKFLQTTALCPK